MRSGQNIASDTASALSRAREVLCGQLELLVRLADIALGMLEIAAKRMSDPARPLGSIFVIEKAIHRQARLSWALRLIEALQDKLRGDLDRVERGELVDAVGGVGGVAEPERRAAKGAVEPGERREHAGRERSEAEHFGRYFSKRNGDDEFAKILQRPTEEVIAMIREALGLFVGQEREGDAFEVAAALMGGKSKRRGPKAGGAQSGIPPPI